MVELTRKQRKGVGYMIEGFVAAITIFIFAFGQSPAETTQDWTGFQSQITANDLSYTLRETGDINHFLKLQNTGSLETAVSSMTEEQLKVSGTVENLPLNDGAIGFTSTNFGDLEERHTDSVTDVSSGDQCDGDLEEIEQQPGTSIKRTEDPSLHDGVVLYFADTDPQISGGTNGDVDYDTLYVDNQTRCQFSASEGPYYIDELFRWNTSVSGEYEYYDFKNIDSGSNEFTYYNATLAFKIKNEVDKPINGIETSQEVDTFNLQTRDLDVYDLIVIRREEAIEYLNSNPDEEQKIKDYMKDNPVLIIANLTKSTSETGFIDDTGLEWVDLSYSSQPDNYQFSYSTTSRKVETYFEGLDGNILTLDLPPGGKLSSANSDSITDDEPLLYARDGTYATGSWNSINNNMNQVDPDNINGKPESACYNPGPSSSLTKGTFSFPDNTSDFDVDYEVINAEMGKNSGDCTGIRALSIDFDGDDIYTEEGEGPFFAGERIIIESKTYTVEPTGSDSAELIFTGNINPEIANYRTSFEEFRGDKLGRIAYREDYSDEGMKVIASTVYWLLGDTTEFGDEETSSISTTVLGSINENVYMPYKISLRWR